MKALTLTALMAPPLVRAMPLHAVDITARTDVGVLFNDTDLEGRTTAFILAALAIAQASAVQAQTAPPSTTQGTHALLNQFCVSCHNERLRTGGLMLDNLNAANPAADPKVWEQVVEFLVEQGARPRTTVATSLKGGLR